MNADVGYVYENVVSQMLVAGRHKLYYHTWPTPSGKHNYEIDFLLSRQAKVCPIEVKSSTSNVHESAQTWLLTLDASSVKTALTILLDKDLIYHDAKGYWVYDRFFDFWLKQLI
jgi:predicted AAA+ superfamily ATPase